MRETDLKQDDRDPAIGIFHAVALCGIGWGIFFAAWAAYWFL